MEVSPVDREALEAMASAVEAERLAPARPAPFVTVADAVPRSVHDELWAALLSQQASFRSNQLPGRRALVLDAPVAGIDEFARALRSMLEVRLAELLRLLAPDTAAAAPDLRLPSAADLVVSAHGHGDHLGPHTDHGLPTSPMESDRVLTIDYYLASTPRRFAGGQLRLFGHRQVADRRLIDRSFVDIEPDDGLLVIHPPWVAHEVVTVRLPGDDFRGRRFAVTGFVRTAMPVSEDVRSVR